ncbi:MAG: translocation/assembly module TamB domain-containing protein [Acidobacteriota bacterium]|nr:translocation/assembly module TamB domain-containing protein [Acidobacteriota bacterium]
MSSLNGGSPNEPNPLQRLAGKVERLEDRVKQSLARRLGRGFGWGVLSILGLLVLLITVGSWYTTTDGFQQRVRSQVIAVLEDATGGRVELRSIHFSLWHLAVDADGLVIHGLEAADQAPYLSAEHIELRLRILHLLERAAGSFSSRVSLDRLWVQRPQVHLIIDKDGHTNQPVPRHATRATQPLTDTLLDLKAGDVRVTDGTVLLNDQPIPFAFAARELDAQMRYQPGQDAYAIQTQIADLRTRMAAQPEVRSTLAAELTLGRNVATLSRLSFRSGGVSELTVSGELHNFAQPSWKVTGKGSIALGQLTVLGGIDGFKDGTAELDGSAHSCPVAEQSAPADHSWMHRLTRHPGSAVGKLQPTPQDCTHGYVVTAKARLHNASYRNEYVRYTGINGGGEVRITPDEMRLTNLVGNLPGGGSAEGSMRISQWMAGIPDRGAPRTAPFSHTVIEATVHSIPLRTILDTSAPEHFGDLGFDTAITGPVQVEYGGPTWDIASTVEVEGDLTAAPTGVSRRGALNNVPVTGSVVAHYTGSSEVVRIQRVQLHSPSSTLEASGVLGVNLGDPLTVLHADASLQDLGEFEQLLQTLGFSANGKKGVAAVPVVLHGQVEFHGTARGEIANLDLKGHATAQSLEARLSDTTDVLIDSIDAEGEFSPRGGLQVTSATLQRGTAVLRVGGTMRPRVVMGRHGPVDAIWDDGMTLDVHGLLETAPVQDVLQIIGQQSSVPLTGTARAELHMSGTAGQPEGSGSLELKQGVAYGQPYDAVTATLALHGQRIAADHVLAQYSGIVVRGSGSYDLQRQRVAGHLEADRVVLSRLTALQHLALPVDGLLWLRADADGTVQEPGLRVQARLDGLQLQGQQAGNATLQLNSVGKLLRAEANGTLLGAQVAAKATVALDSDWTTEAQLNLTQVDAGRVLALLAPNSVALSSAIDGQVTVAGSLAHPQQLHGDATLHSVDLKLQGLELRSAGPVHAALQQGTVQLDHVHITGQDTDLQAAGSMQLFGARSTADGKLNMKANGSVSVALVHTFDPDIVSSGKMEFAMAATGTLSNPALTGRIQFDNVNASVYGVANGLNNMNGTLVFNEDRLQVQSLTATTGGGLLKIGGSIRYRNGVYADLTATGDAVRVRYDGLSATANANLRLQGTTQSALLSGSILVTRFGIGPDVDFAAFAGAADGGAPVDPNAATNKIRLDVHLTSSPQLDFQNSYAKLAGAVDLTVRGTVANPTVLGRIQITDGSATFSGTKYQLQRGDIYFTNPVRVEPTIDIDATARVENYDITLGVHGTPSNLRPTYRSEPPLSEADIFALLALGRTQEEAQLYQEQQAQVGVDPTTSSLLGGALNATVSSRVEKLFGVGSVKIDPAFVGTLGNSSARITVQQQLSRQFTATFATNVNTTAQQLIQLQYDLSRDVSIVASRDESGVFSVVYKLRRRYR